MTTSDQLESSDQPEYLYFGSKAAEEKAKPKDYWFGVASFVFKNGGKLDLFISQGQRTALNRFFLKNNASKTKKAFFQIETMDNRTVFIRKQEVLQSILQATNSYPHLISIDPNFWVIAENSSSGLYTSRDLASFLKICEGDVQEKVSIIDSYSFDADSRSFFRRQTCAITWQHSSLLLPPNKDSQDQEQKFDAFDEKDLPDLYASLSFKHTRFFYLHPGDDADDASILMNASNLNYISLPTHKLKQALATNAG